MKPPKRPPHCPHCGAPMGRASEHQHAPRQQRAHELIKEYVLERRYRVKRVNGGFV